MRIRSINWEELEGGEVIAILEDAAKKDGKACAGFLDVHQWSALAARKDVLLDGGYPEAQFKTACIGGTQDIHVYAMPNEGLPRNVRSPRSLRLFLQQRGGLVASDIGDVLMQQGYIVYSIVELDTLEGLNVEKLTGFEPRPASEKAYSVASVRVDAVASSVFNVSRKEAQTAIKYGFVWINEQKATKASQTVKEGNSLIFRTKGRCSVIADEGATKSGRRRYMCRVYPC